MSEKIRVLLSEEEVEARIRQIAAKISKDYAGKLLLLVGVLKGSVVFISDLMKNISMVFQDVYLFQDTIRNNIRFGKNDATDEEIIEAAKKAQCHEFITKLSKGYDTMVGEGGCTLSGGEKQRLSIARAILKDAPVVFLDEATASLDPENEVEVQRAINTLIAGRTVIVIAHRLKTCLLYTSDAADD